MKPAQKFPEYLLATLSTLILLLSLKTTLACPPQTQDIADIPSQRLHADADPNKIYFLIGPQKPLAPPPKNYRLIIILPGGDGSADFHPFVKRIYKNALSHMYIAAQPVSIFWDKNQQVVWPTKTNPYPAMKFSTEEFIEAVVRDVKNKHPIDPNCIFTLSWSSSGPACYAASLQKEKSITGSFIAMSVFKPDQCPPLANAVGHAYAILHSPDDWIPIKFAEDARDQLTENGARVKFMTYPGGHGWIGNVYYNISKGIQFLEIRSLNAERIAKRNTLLATADHTIRKGLAELSLKFPQLKKDSEYDDIISTKSSPGRIGIWLNYTNIGKAKNTDNPVPPKERFNIMVYIRPSTNEMTQMAYFNLYPNLDLVGQRQSSAGDPELAAALKKLVDDSLKPLQILDSDG